MYKLLIFTVVGLCSLLVAKCDDKFYEEWKEFMDESYCKTEDPAAKDKYMECTKMFPDKVTEIILKETESEDMEEAMNTLCVDEEVAHKVCGAMKGEDMNELGMDEEKMETLRECKNKE